jgi:hypothetical protein
VRRVLRRHPAIPFWLCVGDVADDQGRYEPFDAPVYWIKGNNENFDVIEAAPREQPAGAEAVRGSWPAHLAGLPNLFYIPNGVRILIAGGGSSRAGDSARAVSVAGLGGTLAPTWYETPARELPHPKKGSAKATELADKRRHFVRDEVEACKAMRDVDVFLSHEAARPFRIGRMDGGKTPINEVLAAMKPRLHLFGHHHRFSEQVVQGVPSVGLDLVSRSHLLIDFATLKYDVQAS